MAKILLVEDDQQFALMVSEFLKFEHHMVETAATGKEALDRMFVGDFDLIILDWSLPDIDGIELCKKYRDSDGHAPVLMLTAKSRIVEKEYGLDSGADDFLTKPCHVRELSARVRALLRRGSGSRSNILQIRDLTLDPGKFELTKSGVPIKLLPKEFALLEFLMRNPDKVFSGEVLLQRVWHTESDATIEAIRTCIKRLRKKIDDSEEDSIIETVARVGYRVRSK